jgi:hypothetical protein
MRCTLCNKFARYDAEAPNNRMVFACPDCVNNPKLRNRWEAEK